MRSSNALSIEMKDENAPVGIKTEHMHTHPYLYCTQDLITALLSYQTALLTLSAPITHKFPAFFNQQIQEARRIVLPAAKSLIHIDGTLSHSFC